MFKKLLIANRGEIAIRIARACRELCIHSVAAYTDIDRDSRHIQLADQAFSLGEATYLDMDALWALAAQAGCDAIHPGYGFLAENAAFARGTAERGLVWVGPSAAAIDAMGSKLAARAVAAKAGVPCVPGSTEAVTDPAVVKAFGAEHGWPLLLKAIAGGGGRGQVVLQGPDEVEAGLERAQREGLSYFGDSAVFVERFLQHPRHVEIQVVADQHGTVLHLGERDCSIQRRNQKLVEESPSPALDATMRQQMGDASVRLARAVGYDSVGTCEYMYEDGKFYFLEMNTRIQVEHTVTEVVYRCDLVKEMLKIAGGAPVDPTLVGRQPEGWAIQVRVNAEDPSANYRPTPGRLTKYVRPEGPGVRLDGAAYEGWTIPNAYDSMIAKLITWGSDRSEAIARMKRALHETVVEGVPTTLPLHAVIMENPTFVSGDFSTRFLLDCLSEAERARIKEAIDPVVAGGDEPVPTRTLSLEVNRQRFEVIVRDPGLAMGGVGAGAARGPVKPAGPGKAAGKAAAGSQDGVLAPMMSKVVKVSVAVGDTVTAGQPLVVVEAMKMESELVAPRAGKVKAVGCAAGETVQQGQVLVSLE